MREGGYVWKKVKMCELFDLSVIDIGEILLCELNKNAPSFRSTTGIIILYIVIPLVAEPHKRPRGLYDDLVTMMSIRQLYGVGSVP